MTLHFVQTLMLSRALDGDVSRGFDEIQKRVGSEHAWSEALSAERKALADKVKALEAWMVELEGERADLQEEVRTLRGVQGSGQPRDGDSSGAGALALYCTGDLGAMETLEGAVVELVAMPPPRRHTVGEMDITHGRLRRVGEVCLLAARA